MPQYVANWQVNNTAAGERLVGFSDAEMAELLRHGAASMVPGTEEMPDDTPESVAAEKKAAKKVAKKAVVEETAPMSDAGA